MPTILRRPTHMILVTGMTPNGLNMPDTSQDDYLSPQPSSKHSNGSESNQCGTNRLSSNRRYNGSSLVNPTSSKNGLGTDEENRNLMAETRFRAGPRTPRWENWKIMKILLHLMIFFSIFGSFLYLLFNLTGKCVYISISVRERIFLCPWKRKGKTRIIRRNENKMKLKKILQRNTE